MKATVGKLTVRTTARIPTASTAHAKLEADGEHDENDADFGDLLHALGVGEERVRDGRADDQAGEEIAENRRLSEAAGQNARHRRDHGDHREIRDQTVLHSEISHRE